MHYNLNAGEGNSVLLRIDKKNDWLAQKITSRNLLKAIRTKMYLIKFDFLSAVKIFEQRVSQNMRYYTT